MCVFNRHRFVCVPQAAPIVLSSCELATACEAGTACLPPEQVPDCDAEPCCSPWCDVTSPDADLLCGAGSTCQPWYEPDLAPKGLEHVGVCLPE